MPNLRRSFERVSISYGLCYWTLNPLSSYVTALSSYQKQAAWQLDHRLNEPDPPEFSMTKSDFA